MKLHNGNTHDQAYAKMLDLLIPTVFDEISEIVSIKSPDQTILFYNHAGFKALNKKPEEVIGKKCYELIGRNDLCEGCPGSNAAKSGKSSRAEVFFDKLVKWFEINAMPVCDKNGKVIFILEILRDITHLKQLQEELLKYENGSF